MKGPWHYTEAERLGQLATDRSDRLANKGAMVASQAEVEQRTISQLIALAQVHATLAGAAASTVHAFFDVDEPEAWAQAFGEGDETIDEISIDRCTDTEPHAPHPGRGDYTTCPGIPEPAETPEQSAAIVDANLDRMGLTLGGETYDGTCHDPQHGDSTWDHECPLPPGDYQVTNGITYEAEIVEAPPGQMRQDYERNRAQGRDQVESAARAIVGLT